jgi:hypothetical protein
MRRSILAFIFGVSVMIGCGQGSSPPSPESPAPEVSSEIALKERLEFIAENGGMGSAFAGIVEMCEKNGDKALVAEAKKLLGVQDPETAKKIAKGMLTKLK